MSNFISGAIVGISLGWILGYITFYLWEANQKEKFTRGLLRATGGSLILFFVVSFVLLFPRIWEINNYIAYLEALATFILGIVGAYFAYMQQRKRQDLIRGSLLIEMSNDRVLTVKNQGGLPINIVYFHSKLRDNLRREKADKAHIFKEFDKLKKEIDDEQNLCDITYERDIILNKNDYVIIPRENIKGAIEEEELVIEIIKLIYESDGRQYIKYVYYYWLTEPRKRFEYIIRKAIIRRLVELIDWGDRKEEKYKIVMNRMGHVLQMVSYLDKYEEINSCLLDFLVQIDSIYSGFDSNRLKEQILSEIGYYLGLIEISSDFPQHSWQKIRVTEK